jgi:hypothetical protein
MNRIGPGEVAISVLLTLQPTINLQFKNGLRVYEVGVLALIQLSEFIRH